MISEAERMTERSKEDRHQTLPRMDVTHPETLGNIGKGTPGVSGRPRPLPPLALE
jgi:hypothetical protein